MKHSTVGECLCTPYNVMSWWIYTSAVQLTAKQKAHSEDVLGVYKCPPEASLPEFAMISCRLDVKWLNCASYLQVSPSWKVTQSYTGPGSLNFLSDVVNKSTWAAKSSRANFSSWNEKKKKGSDDKRFLWHECCRVVKMTDSEIGVKD